MIAHLQLVEPCNVNRKVQPAGPGRPTNKSLRTREYLTPAEIDKLIKAAKEGRWGHRDATLILVGYRHGLRAVYGYSHAGIDGRREAGPRDQRPMAAGPNLATSGRVALGPRFARWYRRFSEAL
jgi:hypothetical protein